MNIRDILLVLCWQEESQEVLDYWLCIHWTLPEPDWEPMLERIITPEILAVLAIALKRSTELMESLVSIKVSRFQSSEFLSIEHSTSVDMIQEKNSFSEIVTRMHLSIKNSSSPKPSYQVQKLSHIPWIPSEEDWWCKQEEEKFSTAYLISLRK